jgi:hypothetical protein
VDAVARKLEAWLDAVDEPLVSTWDAGRLNLHEVVDWMRMAEGLRPES